METNNKGAKMTLGEKLKSARKNAGFTQEQLAEKITVKKFEIGNFLFTDCGVISETK